MDGKNRRPYPGQCQANHLRPGPNTYLLAILAGKQPPDRRHIIDVLGRWAQQVAWDVVLILLWLGGLKHIALSHPGGHHHLRADS